MEKKWKNGRKNGKKSGRMEEKYKFQKLINWFTNWQKIIYN